MRSTATKIFEPNFESSFNYKSEVSYSEVKSTNADFPQARTSLYIQTKYLFERATAVIGLLLISPLLITVALLIKVDSKGPIFFRQKRYGLEGKEFEILKFRTMVENAHEMQRALQSINEMKGGKLFKSDKDPRITKLGKFLRKYSIDELPQLINIAKGEMTLIGPRPISTPIEEYEKHELARFSVKPGLGCIWQAYFRGQTDFRMWMRTDAIYVNNISFVTDIKLFLVILWNVIVGKGAR